VHRKTGSFLATDDQFEEIQRLQRNNLIVPLVGDFAGPKAIRSVGQFAEEHGSTIHVFYTSNVEEYLFQDSHSWKEFYKNVASLPTDSNSMFIRYVLNGSAYSQHRRSLTSTMQSTLAGYRAGVILGYEDVLRQSH